MQKIFDRIHMRIYFKLSDIVNKGRLLANHVYVGKSTKINGLLRISNSLEGTIRIGNSTLINSSWYANKAGGGQNRTSLITENLGKIMIGDNVGISNSTLYSRSSITIEDRVLIGVNCVIYDNDFHSINISDRLNNNCGVKTAPVVIKSGAWIGGHCIVLKGVTIGENSVIGAGSIVTHDVPNNELWAGNPAKFIKKI